MTEKYAIRLVGGGTHAGKYLVRFDPHWQLDPSKPQEQSGIIDVTKRKEDAHLFDTPLAAWLCGHQQSNTFPVRADGKPNQPLLVYGFEIVRVKV